MANKITECPYCGSTLGYYRTGTVSGKYAYWYEYDGSSADNTEMHNGLIYHEHKTCYCTECHKALPIKHKNE